MNKRSACFPALVRRTFAVFVMGAVLFAAAAPALRAQDKTVQGGLKVSRNIEYSKPAGRSQLMDIFVSENVRGKQPVVVWIHGGGWQSGSKEGCPAIPLAKAGYVVASINYRLSDVAVFPAQIEDCKAAIRFLRAHAAEYQIDPDHIGVWGASAGGHLVALLGTSIGVKVLEGSGGNPAQASTVQAVCDWFGPSDFCHWNALTNRSASGASAKIPGPVQKLLGGAVGDNMEKAAQASPVTYVESNKKSLPPFLIMHGDSDKVVPLAQSEMLCAALKKAGADATLHVVKGAGHGFGGPEILKKVKEFFDRTLNPTIQ